MRAQPFLVPVWFVALGLIFTGCGSCVASRGVLVGARPDASFVTEKSAMYVATAAGIEHVSLDGRTRRVVFNQRWHVQDVTSDFTTWVLGNDHTEYFVGDARNGAVRKIDVVGNRGSSARISPDGKRVAIARHSDFSRPQSDWKDDDTIYVVDLATLAAQTIPPATSHWPQRIAWAADGSALWIEMNFEKPPQWITLADGKRTMGLSGPPSALAEHVPLRADTKCEGKKTVSDRWDTSITVVRDGAAQGVVVAKLEGRKRGFHDYQADFDDVGFSPGCGYVVFNHEGRMFAVPVDGSTGPGVIVEGSRLSWAR